MGVSTNEQRELKLNSEIAVSSFVLDVVLGIWVKSQRHQIASPQELGPAAARARQRKV